jgi:hypothetical protein
MISALGCGAPVLVLLSWVRHVNNGVPSMAYGDRKSERVEFGRGIDVHIMGIDGTWRRDCTMNDGRLANWRATDGEWSNPRAKSQGVLFAFVVHRTCLSPLPNGSTRWGSNRSRIFEADNRKIKEGSE